MTTSAPCPNCSAKLKLPDAAFGRPVTCPKCGVRVTVPKPGEFEAVEDSPFEVVDDGGFEEVPDEPPAPARARPATARPARPVRPAPRDTAADDDEDADDRPRRRGREPAPGRRVPKWVFAVGGAAVFALVFGGGAVLWLAGAFDPSPPPGFSVAKSRAGGYRVFLPGPVTPVTFNDGPNPRPDGKSVRDVDPHAHSGGSHGGDGGSVQIMSVLMQGSYNPGGGQDELLKLMKSTGGARYDGPWYTRPEVKAVTLGGRPGIQLRVKDKPDWMDDGKDKAPTRPARPANLPPDVARGMREADEQFERIDQEHRAARAKDVADRVKNAKSYVILFTTDGSRTYLIELEKKGDFDDATLDTVRNSFTLLTRGPF